MLTIAKGIIMKHLGKLRWLLLLAAPVVVLCAAYVEADDAEEPVEQTEDFVVRMYDISDLVEARLRDDRRYVGYAWPSTTLRDVSCGADFFDDGFDDGPSPMDAVDGIIDLIQNLVLPYSWSDEAILQELDGVLIIRQVPTAHAQIEELLAMLREALTAWPTVTIHAQWLNIPTEEYLALTSQDVDGPVIINSDQLDGLDATVRYSGLTTCRSGQAAHLSSGVVQTEIRGLEPLVTDNAVCLRPIRDWILFGALLKARPILLPEREEAIVYFGSEVTESLDIERRMMAPATATDANEPSRMEIDMPRFLRQTLVASARLPLGQPVLVGAMTAPEEEETGETVLCLVMQVSVDEATPEADE